MAELLIAAVIAIGYTAIVTMVAGSSAAWTLLGSFVMAEIVWPLQAGGGGGWLWIAMFVAMPTYAIVKKDEDQRKENARGVSDRTADAPER